MVGGELITALAEATETRILPVDSEHSAIFQLLEGEAPGSVDRLVLTASGGPFRGRTDLSGVGVEEALAHPTWVMGGRITIDSATLFNKGLELIEAHHLFGVPYERIDVVVHPQSIVHSLIELNDGASARPPRPSGHEGADLLRAPPSRARRRHRSDARPGGRRPARASSRPDLETFPCLRLAREAGLAGGTAPCALNAADEVAVAAFLDGRIAFTAIAEVIAGTLDEVQGEPRPTSSSSSSATHGPARLPPGWSGGRRWARDSMSWILAFARLRGADHLPRGGPLHRREARRHAGRALLLLLPAEALERAPR